MGIFCGVARSSVGYLEKALSREDLLNDCGYARLYGRQQDEEMGWHREGRLAWHYLERHGMGWRTIDSITNNLVSSLA